VERGAYAEAIRNRDPRARVQEISCSLFVALAEEGWTEGPIVDAIAGGYLGPVLDPSLGNPPDSVILGCTHFGLLEAAIRRQLGDGFSLVDSARTAAGAVRKELDRRALRATRGRGRVTFMVTDHPDRFARVGRAFLGDELSGPEIQWIDL
jgi:glutamate racemase